TLTGGRGIGEGWKFLSIVYALPAKTKMALLIFACVLTCLSGLSVAGFPPALSSNPLSRFMSALGLHGRLVVRDEIVSSSPVLTAGKGRIATLRGRNLQYMDAQRSTFVSAQLMDATLDYADLSGATFDLADLQGASLKGANLTGTSLRGAHLEKADLR